LSPGDSSRHLVLGSVILVVGSVILLGGILRDAYLLNLDGRLFVDWVTYANAVQRWLAGAPIYAQQQLSGSYYLPQVVGVGFAYPPATVPLFLPFAAAPVGVALWILLNVGVFVTGIVAVLRRELGGASFAATGLVLAVLAICPPFTVGVAAGNVNVALAGVFAWAWAAGRGASYLPMAAVISAAVKLTPASLLGWGDRRPRRYAAQGGVALVVVLATVPLTGAAAWHDYVVALFNSTPICHLQGALPSVPCVAAALLGSDALARAATIGAFVALTLAAWWTPSPLAAYLMIAAAWMIPTADVHKHSLLVPLVALLVVALRLYRRLRLSHDRQVPADIDRSPTALR
jgi:hypothetical protein